MKGELEKFKELSHKEFTALSEHAYLKSKELENTNSELLILNTALKCTTQTLTLALKAECAELGTRVVSYEQIICSNEDTNAKLESVEQTVEALKHQREKLGAELQKTSTQLAQASETAQGKDEQIAMLKSIVQDLTVKMQAYEPTKVSLHLTNRATGSTSCWRKN